MSDYLYRNIFNTMTDEQQDVMCDLYMKGFNHDGHLWNTFTDIEHAVAQILILERNRNDKV